MTTPNRPRSSARASLLAGAMSAGAGLIFVGGGMYSLWYTYTFVPPGYGWEYDLGIQASWIVALLGVPAVLAGMLLAATRRTYSFAVVAVGMLTALIALAEAVTTGSWLFGPAGPIPALVVGLVAAYLLVTMLVLRRGAGPRPVPGA
jgi:hypothetical protein